VSARREPLRAPEPEPVAPAAGGHLFTLREAAEACGVSRDTIKRRNAAGRFPGAQRDDAGAWLVPLADLLADGLHPNAPVQGEAPPQGAAPPPADAEQVARMVELEAQVRELRARLDERERALQLAEMALRALPAGAAAPPEPQGGAPGRRSWWRRG